MSLFDGGGGLLDKAKGLLGKLQGSGILNGNKNQQPDYLAGYDSEDVMDYDDSDLQKINPSTGSGWFADIINGFTGKLDGVPVAIPKWVMWLGIGFLVVLAYKFFGKKGSVRRRSPNRKRKAPQRKRTFRRSSGFRKSSRMRSKRGSQIKRTKRRR